MNAAQVGNGQFVGRWSRNWIEDEIMDLSTQEVTSHTTLASIFLYLLTEFIMSLSHHKYKSK